MNREINGGHQPEFSIIVPVYNEISSLPELIRRLKKYTEDGEIIFVDDGSLDGSREFLQTAAFAPSKKVILHKHNRGRGAAIRTGLAQARGKVIAPQDADLEYDPQDLIRLIDIVSAGEALVVYGSRFMGEGSASMSRSQFWGNRFVTAMCNILYGTSLTDLATCYKVYRADIIKRLVLSSDRFELEAEVTAKLLRRGVDIREEPINFSGRTHAEGKKLTWRDGLSMAGTLIRYRIFD